ncbi:hypothetical protein ON010_g571 [Phytophthora cinnamomi]|nr:hypothetical protein ON010_g571 [Phytophthora cinnamomi]
MAPAATSSPLYWTNALLCVKRIEIHARNAVPAQRQHNDAVGASDALRLGSGAGDADLGADLASERTLTSVSTPLISTVPHQIAAAAARPSAPQRCSVDGGQGLPSPAAGRSPVEEGAHLLEAKGDAHYPQGAEGGAGEGVRGAAGQTREDQTPGARAAGRGSQVVPRPSSGKCRAARGDPGVATYDGAGARCGRGTTRATCVL